MTTVSEFETALLNSWSLESSALWTKNTPAAGQCGVTALVANDVLGAEVLKTRYGDLWHFCNRLDGLRYDFTDSQFDAPIVYDDILSNREEAFGDTNASQYNYLRDAVVRHLER